MLVLSVAAVVAVVLALGVGTAFAAVPPGKANVQGAASSSAEPGPGKARDCVATGFAPGDYGALRSVQAQTPNAGEPVPLSPCP